MREDVLENTEMYQELGTCEDAAQSHDVQSFSLHIIVDTFGLS